METLPETLHKNGLDYKLVKRNDKAAMYEQFMEDGSSVGFEVFNVKIQKPVKWPNGTITPEKEAFPHNEAFGLWAWAFCTRPTADKKYDEITNEVVETTTRFVDGEEVTVRKKKNRNPVKVKMESTRGRGRPKSENPKVPKVTKPREKFTWQGVEYNSKSDVARKLLTEGVGKQKIADMLKITVQTVHATLVKMQKAKQI